MARWSTVEVEGQPMRVYLDVPSGGGGAVPGVLVMMHGPGLDRFAQDRVEDLARHGYAAIAPDLYHRQAEDGADVMTRVGRLRDHEILSDADAALAHLMSLPDAQVGEVAVLGFCMGGRNTYMLAGARPSAFRAAVVFYGGNIMKAWGEGPTPFDLTAHIACPLLGVFGVEDGNPSPEDVKKIDAELARHGKAHTFHSYQGAGHAFLNFMNAERYRPQQGADAWKKALDFLGAHLKHGAD